MADPHLFLDTLCRQLEARDARLELGGQPPIGDDKILFADAGNGWRVVVIFDEPVSNPAVRRQKLMALSAAFPGAIETAANRLPMRPVGSREQDALDTLLATIATMSASHWVGVIDNSTDQIWGTSKTRWDVVDDPTIRGALQAVQALDDRDYHLHLNGGDNKGGWLARAFGGVYWVVLVFDGPFSELAADGQLVRALPLIEARVVALKPRDPDGSDPSKSNVLRLRG